MATIREQIMALALTTLNTSRPAGVPAVIRTRVETPAKTQLPALTLYQKAEKVERMHDPTPGGAPHQRTAGPIVRRTLVLAVESLTKRVDPTVEDQAADPLLAWGTKALIQKFELDHFGSLARHFDETGTEFAYEQSDAAYCRATQLFEVSFQTLPANAELKK